MTSIEGSLASLRSAERESLPLRSILMYYLYILYSLSHRRTYVGQTDDREIRLQQHNSGKVRSTKAFRPWVMVYSEAYETRADALAREKWFKSTTGRKKIGVILKQRTE